MTSPYRGHDPQTPPGAEAALASYVDALEHARKALADTRNAEVDARASRDAAKRRAILSPECPKVRRDQCTVAERDAWVEDRIADEDLAYEIAKAARQAAGDHLHTLGKQGSLAQSLSKSVMDSYRGQRGDGW